MTGTWILGRALAVRDTLPRTYFEYLASLSPDERDRDMVTTVILRADAPDDLIDALTAGLESRALSGAIAIAAALRAVRGGQDVDQAAEALIAGTDKSLEESLPLAPQDADTDALVAALLPKLDPFRLRGVTVSCALAHDWGRSMAGLRELQDRMATQPHHGALTSQAIAATKNVAQYLARRASEPAHAARLVTFFTDVLRHPVLVRTAAGRIPEGLPAAARADIADAVVTHLLVPYLQGRTSGQLPWESWAAPRRRITAYLTAAHLEIMQAALAQVPLPEHERDRTDRQRAQRWLTELHNRLYAPPQATSLLTMQHEDRTVEWLLSNVDLSTADVWRTLVHLTGTLPASATVADLAAATNGITAS